MWVRMMRERTMKEIMMRVMKIMRKMTRNGYKR